jgi:hypothetical protein
MSAWTRNFIDMSTSTGADWGKLRIFNGGHQNAGNLTLLCGLRDDSGQSDAGVWSYVWDPDDGSGSIPDLVGWTKLSQNTGETYDFTEAIIMPNGTVIALRYRRSQPSNWAPSPSISHYPYSSYNQNTNWNNSDPDHTYWFGSPLLTGFVNGSYTDQNQAGFIDWSAWFQNRQSDTGEAVSLYGPFNWTLSVTDWKMFDLRDYAIPPNFTSPGSVHISLIEFTSATSTPGGFNYTAPPGVDPQCVDNYLTINYGSAPYSEAEIQEAIDFCDTWEDPGPTPPPGSWSSSRKQFKLYFLFLGIFFIAGPWVGFAVDGDPKWIGYILLLNALGVGLIIEFMRL